MYRYAKQHLIFKSLQQLKGQIIFIVYGLIHLHLKLWGWKLEGGVFTPAVTDMNAAPDNLLKFIQCKPTACGIVRRKLLVVKMV